MMERIGLTRKQKRQLLLFEGFCYFLIIEGMIISLGTAMLYLIQYYMQKKVTYFMFQYPIGWLMGVSIGLLGICLIAPNMDIFMTNKRKTDVTGGSFKL